MAVTAPISGKATITSVDGLAAGSTTGSNPVIQGMTDANSVVMIYDGVRLVGSALSAADGSWSFAPTMDMKGGNHVLRVIKVESDGSYAATSDSFVATVAPVVVSPPVIGDISHAAAEGHVPANGATSDTHPVISGTGTPGDTVKLFDNTTLIGSALVDASGNWSVQPVAALADGAHALSATETSPGGTTSATSGAWDFTVDTSVPVVPVIGGMTNDDGLPITGGITNDPHPTFNGTGTAGDTVTVYDGDTPIGSVVIGGDGTWSFTPTTDLSPGTHDIVVIETNPAGTPSAQTDPISVVIDVSVPTAPIIGGMTNDDGLPITGGITNDPHPTFNGTGTAGDTVTVYDGDTPIGSVVIGGDGTWSFTPTTDLSPGTHDIVVIETNPAGTPSAQTDPISVVIDVSVPAVPVINGMTNDDGLPITGGITNDPHPTINGTGTAGDTVTVYDGNTPIGSVVIGGDGTWSFTPTTDLSPGTHDIVVIETNPAGTPSAQTDPISVVIDVSVPTAPIIGGMTNDDGLPITGGITNDPHPTINGTGTAGDTVTVYDGNTPIGSVVIGGDGTWSFTPTTDLSPGTHDIVVIETNPAGTPSAQTDPISVVIDVSVPTAPIIGGMTNDDGLPITGGITNDPHPTINGTGTAGDTVTVYDGNTPIGSVVIGGDGTWSFTPTTDLSPGTHDIVVIETNPAGTPSAQTDPISVVIDVSVPTAPVIGGMTNDDGLPITGGITNDPHPTINGTGTAGDTVTVYDGDTPIGSVVVNGDGTWSFTPTTDLSPGTHDIVVIETNPAGTPSAQTDPISVVIDVSVPTAPVIGGMTNDDGLPITGGITNDPHPTFNGTGTAGDTVTVYDGDTPIGSVVIGGDGTWSFTPTTDLSPGTHDIVVIETNPAGTPSAQTDPISVVIDVSVPAVPVINGMTNDDGLPITGGITNDPHPTFNGTGTAGDTVTVFDGNTPIGSVVIGGDGTWSFTPTTDLSPGTHDIVVIETNPAGTPSAQTDPISVVIDVSVPAVPVINGMTNDDGLPITGGITNDPHPTINGTGTAGDTVTVFDGNTPIGSVVIGGDGTWSFTPTTDLSPGTHDIVVIETNPAGTPSAQTDPISVVIDVSVPTAPVINSMTNDDGLPITGGITNDPHPTFNGTGTAGDTVTVYDGDTPIGSVVVNGDGTWSFTPTTDLSPGTHDIVVIETNPAGTPSVQTDPISVVIDVSVPTAPVIGGMTNDDGLPITGGITNDPHPTINGTGTAGDTVTVYDGDTPIGSVVIGGDGTWSFTPTTDLSPGTHDIVVIETNPAGTPSVQTDPISVVIDVSVPAVPVINGMTNDDGLPITGGITNDPHPTINGTGTAGDTVTMYDGDTPIGSVVIGGDGTWSFKPTTDLSPGTHDIVVIETNPAGTPSAQTDPISVVIDVSVPTAPVIGGMTNNDGLPITGGITNDPHPTINGTGTAGDTVTVFDGDTPIGSAVIGGDGTWSFTPTTDLSPGTHDIVVIETNPAGTPSAQTDPISVVIDVSVPAVPVINGMTNDDGLPITGGITNDPHPTINGTGTAGDTVTVYDGNTPIGSVVIGGDGTWSFTPTTDLSPGTHDIVVIETNPAGTPSAQTDPISVVVDVSVPTAPVIGGMTNDDGLPITGGITNDPHPTINGTGTAGDTVTVYDGNTPIGSVVVNGDGTWSFTPTTDLSPGTHDIVVIETNPAGTPSAQTDPISVVIDVSVPTTPIIGGMTNDDGLPITGGITNDPHPTINGTGTAGDTVTVYDGDTPIGSVVIGGDGTWSFTPTTDLSPGTHDIVVIETNPAGTPSAQTDPISVVIDVSVPTAPIIGGMTNDDGLPITGGITNDPHPTINGTGTAGDTVTVYDGNTPIGSVAVNGDGTWSFTPTTDLSPGTHDIVVIETNPAGTPSAQTDPISVVIDVSVPTAPVINSMTNDDGLPITGGITNDPHPTFNGTGTAGDTVTVYDGDTPIGSVVIGGDGTWSFTPTTDLSPGTHDIVVIETNPAGTPSAQTDPISVVIDVSVPTTPIIGGMTNDDGLPITGGITNDPHPTINGTGTAGDTVTVFDGNTPIGSVVIGGDGTWSFKPTTDLSPGTHDIVVIETNPAGTPSAQTSPISVVIDTSVPTAPVINGMTDNQGHAITGDTTGDPHPTISGTGTPGDVVTMFDGNTQIGSVVVGPDGNWSLTPSTDLALGTHDISVIETNAAGTSSAPSEPFPVVYLPLPAAPVTAGFDDETGSIKGILADGAITDAAATMISGTGTAGDLIKMYDGATLIGSVTVDATGHWTMPPATLADGPHTLYVTESNASGESPRAAQTAITVDTSVPAAPVIVQLTDDVRGNMTVAPGAVSESGSPHVSFTSLPGATVYIYDGGTLLVSGVAQTGSSEWILPPLTNGDHTLTIRQTNAAGTAGPASSTFAFTVNTTPVTPVIEQVLDTAGGTKGAIAANGFTDDKSPTISGSGTQGEIVKVYDSATLIGSAIVDATGHWSVTPSSPLAEGAHGLTAFQVNKNGLTSAGATQFIFTIDTSVPVAPAISGVTDAVGSVTGPVPNGGTMDDTKPAISGKGIAGDMVQVYDGATLLGSALIDAAGNWTIHSTVALADGTHTLTAVDLNRVGTPSAASAGYTVHVDTTTPAAPSIVLVTDAVGEQTGPIASGATTDDTKPVVNGTGHAGDLIKLYDGAIQIGSGVVGADGKWSIHPTVELPNGAHTLTAVEANLAGTPSAASEGFSFVVDSTAPGAPVIQSVMDATGPVTGTVPAGGTTDETKPVVSGTGTAGDTIRLFDGDTLLGSAVADVYGRWSITVPTALATGDHSLNAVDTNAIGTPSAASAPYDFAVDTNPPGAPVITSVKNTTGFTAGDVAANGTTGGTQPLISGTGHAGDTVKVFDGATLIGSALVDSAGAWSVLPVAALSSTGHDLTAVSTNQSGLTGNASSAFHFTIDTTAPPPVDVYNVLQDPMRSGVFVENGGTMESVAPGFYCVSTIPGNTIRLYDGDTLVSSIYVTRTSGSYFFPPLPNGFHTLTVTQTNALGVESAPLTYTVTIIMVPDIPNALTLTDTVGPITGAVAAGATIDDTQPTLRGSGTRGEIIFVYDGGVLLGSVGVDGAAHWSFNPSTPLLPGPHDFYAMQKNSYGMLSPASQHITFVLDPGTPAAPVIEIVQQHTATATGSVAPGSTTDDAAPTVSGHGAAGHIIKLYDGSTLVGSAVIDADGAWSVPVAKALDAGMHTFTVTETSLAGPVSAASASFAFTVADPAPVAPLIANAAGTIGAAPVTLANGDTTNATKPVINGTSTAGHTVTLYDQGVAVGSALVDASGKWSVTPGTALAAGLHALTAVDTAPGGKASISSAEFDIMVETARAAAPAITSLVAHNGSDTVPVAANGSTYDTTPVLNGTGHKGDTVTIYDGSTSLGTVKVSDSGSWTFQLPAGSVSAGAHSLNATSTNSTGTASVASEAFAFTLAAYAPPKAPTFYIGNDPLHPSGYLLDGYTSESNQPVVTYISLAEGNTMNVYDSGKLIATYPIASLNQGSQVFKLPVLTDGAHQLIFSQVNPQGLSANSAVLHLTINTAPSAPTSVQAAQTVDGITSAVIAAHTTLDTHPVISGRGTVTQTVMVYDGATLLGSAVVDKSGNWSFKPVQPLSTGSHDITVTQVNSLGVPSAASAHFAFAVDPNTPSAPVIASVIDSLAHGTEFVPPGGGSTDTSPVVHGRGFAGHIVTLYDHDALIGSALVDGTGNWTITPASPFANGTHALIATETNPNNGTVSVASNEFDVVIGGGVVQSVHSVNTTPADTGAAATDTSVHTVLHSHEAFVGTTGHQTIDLAVDPNTYFRESTAHIEGAKGGVDVLALVGDHQVLDLTSLTGATSSSKLSGVEVFDLGGHSNTLKLSLVDVLNLGETDMFQLDGNQQVMVNGKAGDSVDLSNTHIAGLKEGEWQAHGTAHVGGIEYSVFEHSSAHAELLVQQGIQTIVH